MRASVLLFILAGFMLPAYGAKRVTVADLEQTLAAARNLSDGDLAKHLSDLELTERLNTTTFDRLKSALPGEQSRRALMILADESAFLGPPSAEIPAQPAPDVAQQRKILALTVAYVSQTVHKMPNFFATRVTRSFEDNPAVQMEIGAGDINPNAAYHPLHLVSDSEVTVSFRDGHELLEKTELDPLVRNLDTAGVFGPILGTVLLDAARSTLAWSHWERDPSGLQAVFRYEVPKERSHYTLAYDSFPLDPGPCSITKQSFSKVVPYHGEMTLDPASGTILRLLLLADLKPDGSAAPSASGIEVEYGQVTIGDKPYFLPVRSVASSLSPYLFIRGAGGVQSCPTLDAARSFQRSLNDVVFKDYHVFRSNSHILTGAADIDRPPPGPPPSAPPAAALAAPPAPAATPPQFAANAPESLQPSPTPVAPFPAASAPPDSPPATSANPAGSAPSAESAGVPLFRTVARQVLVDVVVDKKNGDPVPALPKSDFSVNENSKPQAIDFFEEHSAAAPATMTQPAMPPLPPGAVTNVPTAAPSAALYVLLLDSLNTEPQDQISVRQQVLSYLHKMESGTQVAVFSLGSRLRLLEGFTSDSAALIAAVSDKQAERNAMLQNRSDSADDADAIAHLQAMRSNGVEGLQAAQANIHSYSFGARSSMTFEALNAVAGYLEGIPGRKNLVWFASSFPVVLFPTTAQIEQLKNNPNLPGYVNRVHQTANLFTLSKVAVYPVSGAGVMNSNIGLADSSDAGSAGGTGHFGTAAMPTASLTGEAMDFASAVTTMEQLANTTGGRAFTTNDIDSALHKIVHDSNVYYTVGYAPTDLATDGSFRRIDVKVAGGKYKLAYRQGYNASEPDTTPAENPITPLLQLGLPNATGILFGAKVKRSPGTEMPNSDTAPDGQNTQLNGPLTRYTVSLTIRAEDVFFGQAPNGGRIAKLLIGVKAYGKDGVALNWQASREAAELTPAQYASFVKAGLPVSIDLDLPANTPAQLVTAVYDWNSARSGTLEIGLHP